VIIVICRPSVQDITSRLKTIAMGEKMSLEKDALEMLVTMSGFDMRQIVNTLQMWKTTS